MAADLKQLMERALGDLQPPAGLLRAALAIEHRRRHRRRIAVRAVAGLVTVAVAAFIWGTVSSSNNAGTATLIPASPTRTPDGLIPLAQRRLAPGLTGTSVTGSALTAKFTQSPNSFGGNPVTVINFFGARCGSCRAEMPQVVDAFRLYLGNPISAGPPSGINFVGVDERDSLAGARSYVQRAGLGYPVLFDKDGALQRSWHPALGVPYTVIVDSDGLIAARFTGAVSASTLEHTINEIRLDDGGGGYPVGQGALGLPSAVVNGRTITLAVANARCGNLPELQFAVVSVRVREDVAAVHIEVIAKPNPAATSNTNAQRRCG
jgi:hypothetical protein